MGDISFTGGKIAKAASFDGAGDYITDINSTGLDITNISVSTWVYLNSIGG